MKFITSILSQRGGCLFDFLVATILALVLLLTSDPVLAREFNYAGRITSCKSAGAYRDNQLFMEFASALDNFNTNREERIVETIKSFSDSVRELATEVEKADEARTKRIGVAVAGVVLGAAAKTLSTFGIKRPLSAVEEKALGAVGTRGADWATIFGKYAKTKDVDVVSVAALPASLLLAFSPFGTAEKVWSLGNTSLDIAVAVAEAEIIKRQSQLTAVQLIARAENLANRLQMPQIKQLNLLKNEIDRQCG